MIKIISSSLHYFTIAALLFACACSKADEDVPATSCVMTEYAETVPALGFTETHFLEYDSLRRVIKDSLAGSPSDAWRFSYSGNMINVTRSADSASIQIWLNDEGFPVEVNTAMQWDPGGHIGQHYIADYNHDHTLNGVTATRTVGNIASDTFHLDEIVYQDGNMTSYRKSFQPGNYNCIYYPDKLNKTVFYSIVKIFALIGEVNDHSISNAIPLSRFSPQPFSKNLLKSLSRGQGGAEDFTLNYTYEFDNLGNITKIIESRGTANPEEKIFTYDCQ